MRICSYLGLCAAVIRGIVALDCKTATDFAISSAKDIVSINQCTTFNGTLSIAPGAPQDIALNGPKSITAIHASNVTGLRSLSSRSLEEIGNIMLDTLPQLQTINFSAVEALGSARLQNLPRLGKCDFGAGPRDVSVVFNTSLLSLDWPREPLGTTLNITSNPDLVAIEITCDAIESAVVVANNPSLRSVNVSVINEISGSLDMEGNGKVDTLVFDKLKIIAGKVNISGGFTGLEMPQLESVEGSLRIESTKYIQDFCGGLRSKGFTGDYDCVSNAGSPPSPSSPLTPIDSPGADRAEESDTEQQQNKNIGIALGAKIGIGIASALLFIFLLVGVFFFFRARSRSKVREIDHATIPPTPKPEASPRSTPAAGSAVRLELNGDEIREPEGRGRRTEVGFVGGRDLSARSERSVGSREPLIRSSIDAVTARN